MAAAAPGAPPPGVGSDVPDVTAPTIVHRVKSKMGYTEMHTAAPGFGENVRPSTCHLRYSSWYSNMPTDFKNHDIYIVRSTASAP